VTPAVIATRSASQHRGQHLPHGDSARLWPGATAQSRPAPNCTI